MCVAQTTPRSSRITQEIDSTHLITLRGNVRADLTPDRDLGPVEDGMELRLYLVLQRTPEQQAALDNLLARQQQPTAPEYHHWLTPQEYGVRYGASPEDIAKISTWLEGQGLHVHGVLNNAMIIDCSATALQVREVFHTQLHYYNIRGGRYPANAQEPMIPAALEGVVAGIEGLSRIPLRHHHTKIHPVSYEAATHRWQSMNAAGEAEAMPAYKASSGNYNITPQDYYTIYNVNKVFNGGNLGAGATVAVLEESDIEYGTVNSTTHLATGGDVSTFRSLFGVPGTLTMYVYHGYGTVTCNAPGIDPANLGEDGEAALDAEWANALAPSANLIFMSCDNTTDNGVFTSMAALIDNNLADVMSLSYGTSEIGFTVSNYSFQDTLYAQAAAQGQSFIVSAGDSGSDVNDQNTTGTATSGINVNAFGAPNVTVAGGTDFSDYFDAGEGGPAQSTYWSAANSSYYGDALGYVPETAWSDSCASSLIAKFEGYTGAGYCATDPAKYVAGDVVGGSGGFSTHYAVPAYQSGITGYTGTMRAQPDISAFAADGVWGHYLIFCDSYANAADKNAGNVPCTSPSTFGGAGGTSFVAPSLAGIGGLLVSGTGSRQGLLNPTLYALAKAQFSATATKTACYSNGQTANAGITTALPSAACIFNDVTTGNNDMPCAKGSTNCYVNASAAYGMLSVTGATSLTVAYPSTAGYDEATGIGTLNVYNLITNWNTAFTTTTALTAAPTSISSSQTTTLTATVTPGLPAGQISGSTYTPALSGSVSFAAASTALGNCTLIAGSCSLTVNGSALQPGGNSITATFSGSNNYPASTSNSQTVTVTSTATATTTTVAAVPTSVTYGGTVTLNATVTPASASGTVTFKAGSTTIGTATLSGGKASLSAEAVTATNGFSAGSNTITASYGGDASNLASAGTTTLSVSKVALLVTANNASRLYGAANPSFSYAITGFAGGDTSAVVSGSAPLTSTATTSSPVGTYPITFAAGSLSATNYSFTYVSGTLVVYSTSSSLPVVLQLSPSSATAGGAGFTLTVFGENFAPASIVLWNGSVRTTTYISNTQLNAAISAADLAKEATNLIAVANTSAPISTSSGLPFVVASASPVASISEVTISDTTTGGNYVLSLKGTDFVAGSVIKWNVTALPTSYVSPWTIMATVTPAEYASLATTPVTLTVVNPAGTSAGFVVK